MSNFDLSFKMWIMSNVPVMGLVTFASPAGLRSGTILKFVFDMVNRAFISVHFLACWSGSTPTGPFSLEGSGR